MEDFAVYRRQDFQPRSMSTLASAASSLCLNCLSPKNKRMSFYFQVVFEAVSGSGKKIDIAIDDIRSTEGACQAVGTCSFESGLCTWSNDPSKMIGWNRVNARYVDFPGVPQHDAGQQLTPGVLSTNIFRLSSFFHPEERC